MSGFAARSRSRSASEDSENENMEQEQPLPPLTEKEYTLIFCRRWQHVMSSSSSEIEGAPGGSETRTREILLGMKKRGFGMGKWNGFGGKIEGDETTEEGARRELIEECSIQANQLQRCGFLVFHMMETNKLMKVHVYETWDFTGEPQESEEMRPRWFSEDQIPLSQMWPDDQYWLPLLLDGKRFIGRFDYSDEDTIEDYSVKIQ